MVGRVSGLQKEGQCRQRKQCSDRRLHNPRNSPATSATINGSKASPLRATAPGYGADRDLWLPEHCLIARDDDIAHHGELAPAAQGEPVHSSDHLHHVVATATNRQ